MILIESLLVTISFFSTIPVPILNWTEKRIRFIPMMMPFVGVIIGGLLFIIYYFLNFEPMIASLSFIVIYTILTGGLHNDALMDSSDAHFSRRPMERKLEIMTDSRVGAFAVMSYINYVIILFITMYYFFTVEVDLCVIIAVLMLSRAFVGIMNYNLKYAKEDGLAKMYSTTLKQPDKFVIYALIIVITVYLFLSNPFYLFIPVGAFLFYHYYKRFMYKQFNGITGDLLGTFILLSEVLMFIISAVVVWFL